MALRRKKPSKGLLVGAAATAETALVGARAAASVARLRADVYAFLASALRPPSREGVADLLSLSKLRLLRRAARRLVIRDWTAATDAYARFLAGRRTIPPEELRRELVAEYGRLFVGPGKLGCPPFESVYRDGGSVMGPSTYAVLRLYQEAGFEPEGPREPPDHMAHELQFMSHLCRREGDSWLVADIEAVAPILALQHCFQDDHLCRWAAAFCALLSRATDSGLYGAVAGLLDTWVAADAAVPPAWLASPWLRVAGAAPYASAQGDLFR